MFRFPQKQQVGGHQPRCLWAVRSCPRARRKPLSRAEIRSGSIVGSSRAALRIHWEQNARSRHFQQPADLYRGSRSFPSPASPPRISTELSGELRRNDPQERRFSPAHRGGVVYFPSPSPSQDATHLNPLLRLLTLNRPVSTQAEAPLLTGVSLIGGRCHRSRCSGSQIDTPEKYSPRTPHVASGSRQGDSHNRSPRLTNKDPQPAQPHSVVRQHQHQRICYISETMRNVCLDQPESQCHTSKVVSGFRPRFVEPC
jgi:hypothetical protein